MISRDWGMAAALLLLVTPAVAQESQTTRVEQTQVEQSRQQTAQAWGLDQKEFERFESIMKGPRGTWSPNIDPLTALGLEARTPAERQKYAEQLVKAERARAEAELSLQRAYDAAWKRLYPNDMPVNAFTTNDNDVEKGSRSIFTSTSTAPKQRLSVSIAIDECGECDAVIKRLLSVQVPMDIWVVDSEGKDDRIRSWAAKVGIPPARVRPGDITLNHGGALKIERTDLPRIVPRS